MRRLFALLILFAIAGTSFGTTSEAFVSADQPRRIAVLTIQVNDPYISSLEGRITESLASYVSRCEGCTAFPRESVNSLFRENGMDLNSMYGDNVVDAAAKFVPVDLFIKGEITSKSKERTLTLQLVDAATRKTVNSVSVPYNDTTGRLLTVHLMNATNSLLKK